MTTDALKALIHDQVDLLKDPADLNDLLAIVTLFVDNRTTPMPEETPEQLERLRQQLQAIEDGTARLIPHEQVMREAKQFLEERKNSRKSMTVVNADHLGDYRINVHFSDGTQRIVDFDKAFTRLQSYYAQYRQPDLFQFLTIDNSNLVWGDDWDVIYPMWDLYEGKIGKRSQPYTSVRHQLT